MSTWEQQLAAIRKLRETRNAWSEKVYADKTELAKINRQLEIVRRQPRGNSPDTEGSLEQRKRVLEQAVAEGKTKITTHVKDLHDAVAGIYVEPHPRRATANLKDSIPFLLLPVRIETRFMNLQASPELWLRIYPDDIAIHTHEKWLTPAEVTHGQAYWKNLFLAEKSEADKENLKKSGWSTLAIKFGSQRAAWIARQTKPSNWNDIATLPDTSQLNFPANDTTTENWSSAPRTNVLPDKFVVSLYQHNVVVKEVVCNNIPDELKVGPDPMDADEAFKTVDNKVVFGEDYNWTSDFDKAIEFGMGIKIALTAEQAMVGFDKIIVLGLSLSLDEKESVNELETLIDNHHYSPNGFSIVKQGTPTNNTDQDSGYRSNDPFNVDSYYTETGDPLFVAGEEKDGRFLADALGIHHEVLQNISNADATDRKDATNMNVALYPSTLGYYFDTMLTSAVSEGTQNTIRDFFTKHVSGRGPLPAIRVGNQPYGILLTSDFTKWAWDKRELYDTKFLTGLLSIVKHYDGIWKSLIGGVAYAGKPGSDPAETLINILGLQAGSVAFHQRVGFDKDNLINRTEFLYGGRYSADFQKWIVNGNKAWDFLKNNGAALQDVNGVHQFPQLLQLIYQHYHTTLDANNLVDTAPVSESRRLTNYDEAAQKNYLKWLYETVSASALEKQDFGTSEKPNSLLYQLLRRALLLQIHKSTVNWFDRYGIVLTQASGPVNFYNILPKPTPTKWEIIKAKVAIADVAHPHASLEVGEYLQTSGINETEATYLKKIKEALNDLSSLETGKLERCLTEHLDTCTYRLDAWQTALFKIRLDQQRMSQGLANTIYLGCCGYVEGVRPEQKLRVATDISPMMSRIAGNKPLYEFINNGGFVHAPSLNHALAAAILRSGYLNHANSSNPDILSVNLSSERIRRALFILEGIRNGQRIEALLGYQFERGLHDRASENPTLLSLNAYIYAFRDEFKIDQHYVLQQGTTEAEIIPPNNVVNGLLLAEKAGGYPYGANIPADPTPPGLRDAVIAERDRLNDTLDAIKDLFMSESVYQLVQGNFDRAGAVMTALKDTNVPPELEMIRTPRGSQFGFTNRVTIQFENTGVNPWLPIPMTARARMEPGMNLWIAGMLGDVTVLSCMVSHQVNDGYTTPISVTLNRLNIQAIDLVFISTAELEARIAFYYRGVQAVSDETPIKIEFANLSTILPLLDYLKSLISECRPLDASDFLPSSVSFESGSTNDNLELRMRIDTSLNQFKTKLEALRAMAITVDSNLTTLGEIFDELAETGGELAELDFDFSLVGDLQVLLSSVSEWGLADCFPLRSQADSAAKMALLVQGLNVIRQMTLVSEQVTGKIATATMPEAGKVTRVLIEAGKMLFGSAFNILPKFKYNNAQDIALSHSDSSLLNYASNTIHMDFPADEWMQTFSHVRPRLQKWESIRVLHELRNDASLKVEPVQLPFRINDSWIAVEFPVERNAGEPFTIDTDTLSVVMHGATIFDATTNQSGLLVDDWTETIPVKEEITGIAFNYNQPGSMPPQALLLAVAPRIVGHWNWDDLMGIVNDTFLRAKQRAVEPAMLDKLDRPEVNLLLPALHASFSQYDMDFALDYRLNVKFFDELTPILSAMDSNN